MIGPRWSLTLGFVLALCCVLALVQALLMKSGSAASTPTELMPFSGEVVVLNLKSKESVILEHPQLRRLGDTSFLVGKACGTPETWAMGEMTWCPINDIAYCVEFESKEQWMNEAKRRRREVSVSP